MEKQLFSYVVDYKYISKMWFGRKAVLGSIVNPVNPDPSLLNNKCSYMVILYLHSIISASQYA